LQRTLYAVACCMSDAMLQCRTLSALLLIAPKPLQVFYDGTKNLVYAETRMNKHSSRSHAILQIRVTKWARPVGGASAPRLGRVMCICLSASMARRWRVDGAAAHRGLRRSSGAGGRKFPRAQGWADNDATCNNATSVSQRAWLQRATCTRPFRRRARPRMGRLLARSPSCRSSTSLGRSG